ncbi:MAG TPA: Type 1 glutamine amidotransferase-like domain-containing protein [Candidatus Limnocylindrales bacterium]|jgi:cyanophycinase-like exopeptidase
MTGPIGLHGGGEFFAGDEPFLDALLTAAASAARSRADASDDVAGHSLEESAPALRIAIVPTAAARGRPDLAAATGRAAFERRAASLGLRVTVEVARIVDAASAADPRETAPIAAADLVHLPGGDPDLIPAILAGTPALEALLMASGRGAVVAGASAGAMALAEWTWTPGGGIRGLGLVCGLAVVPHYDDVRRTRWQEQLDELAPGGIGYLGLDERTGVLSWPRSPAGWAWRVVGEGVVSWFARGAAEPVIARHGDVLALPG